MNTPDPSFIRTLTAPVQFNGIGPFAAVRFEILSGVPNCADGYRFRPLRDARADGETEPRWVELPGEWFAADTTPSAERALAVIEAFLAAPISAPTAILRQTGATVIRRLTDAELIALNASTHPAAIRGRMLAMSEGLISQADPDFPALTSALDALGIIAANRWPDLLAP